MRFKLSTIFCLITVLFLVFTLPPPVHSGTLEIRVIDDLDDAEERVSDGDMFKLLQNHLPIIPASSLKPD